MSWLQDIICQTEYSKINSLNKQLQESQLQHVTLQNENQQLVKQVATLMQNASDADSTWKQLYEEILLAKNVYNETPLEAAINSKYKKIRVKYACRHLWSDTQGTQGHQVLSCDVLDFWDYNNQDIQNIATTIKVTNKAAWDKGDWDELAWQALKFVKGYIKYRSDKIVQGVDEYWQFIYETLVLRSGDCEDGAWLLANILVAILPEQERFRVHVCVGPVEGGLHAYCSYRRLTDNRSVILDWCFWVTSNKVKDLPLHSTKYKYYGVNYSVSTKCAFSKIDYYGDDKTLVGVL